MLNLTFRNGNTPALNASNLNAIVNAVNANETALGGKADASHTHAASDISSGVLPINRGGTGQTTAKAAATSLLTSLSNGDTAMRDETLVVTSKYNGSTDVWYKRPASLLWNYIKTKAAAELYITAGWNGDSVLGDYATAEGYQNAAAGDYSHAEGYSTLANGWGYGAHAEGMNTKATGYFTHAEGINTIANGEEPGVSSIQDLGGAHAEGFGSMAWGEQSHAEGKNTRSSNIASHAEGIDSSAGGEAAHAEGWDTSAIGQGSHAEGYGCQAHGNFSHAEGMYTHASGPVQHVFGQYNKSDTTNVEIVGWGTGTATSARKNIRTLDQSGNMTIAGTLTQSSDAKLKTVEGEIPDVSEIHAVRFRWNDVNGQHDDDEHVGYIAQDVQKVAPFLVKNDSNGYLSLDYIALLCAKVDWLEKRVKELEER